MEKAQFGDLYNLKAKKKLVLILCHLKMFITEVRGLWTHMGYWLGWREKGRVAGGKFLPFLLYPQVYVTNRTGMVLGTPTGGGMSQGRLRPEDSWFLWKVVCAALGVRNSKASCCPYFPQCVQDLGACFRTRPEVLFNLLFFLLFDLFDEVLEVFCWIRGSSYLAFHVHLDMFFIFVWESVTEVA